MLEHVSAASSADEKRTVVTAATRLPCHSSLLTCARVVTHQNLLFFRKTTPSFSAGGFTQYNTILVLHHTSLLRCAYVFPVLHLVCVEQIRASRSNYSVHPNTDESSSQNTEKMTLATCALPITMGSSSSLSSVRQRRVAARKTSGIVRASSNASDEVRIVAESTSTTRRQILSTGFAAAVLV